MFVKKEIWVLDTVGTNLLDVLGLDYVDSTRTISNDIMEVYEVLGKSAARRCIYNELIEVLEFDGSYVNSRHIGLLADRMTHSYKLISDNRHGLNKDDIGVIAKASFEETHDVLTKAGIHGELDTISGISANICCGQEGLYGTALPQIMCNMSTMLKKKEKVEYEVVNVESLIDNGLDGVADDNKCSIDALSIKTNVGNITVETVGIMDDDYNPF